MKRHSILIFCLTLFLISTYAQKPKREKVSEDIFGNTIIESNGNRKKISRDIFGYLQYEENGKKKASLKKDIFDTWIYTDDNNNEVKYSKEFWADILRDFRGSDEKVFLWLIDKHRDLKNNKEEYKVDIFDNKVIENNGTKTKIGRDIFGYLQYEANGRKTSLKKDIFDAWIYTDYNKNEIKYSKEFWADILKGFRGDDEKAFFWLMDMSHELRNYKEEYKVDIFDNLQYENNQREKASLKKNIFDEMVYEDSKGNKITYSPDQWRRKMRRSATDKTLFMDMVQSNLFN